MWGHCGQCAQGFSQGFVFFSVSVFICVDPIPSSVQGKRDAFRDHGESVPSQTSILNILALATDKISGEKLSSQQIVAQSQTFILAGATPESVVPVS